MPLTSGNKPAKGATTADGKSTTADKKPTRSKEQIALDKLKKAEAAVSRLTTKRDKAKAEHETASADLARAERKVAAARMDPDLPEQEPPAEGSPAEAAAVADASAMPDPWASGDELDAIDAGDDGI